MGRWIGDKGPRRVHIDRVGRETGRWDVEHRQPLGSFVPGERLIRALKEADLHGDEEE